MYISGASASWGFFQVVEVVQKQRYFKFVISAADYQQQVLFTFCDFTVKPLLSCH